MSKEPKKIFERYKKTTLTCVILLLLGLSVWSLELLLRQVMGFGSPVLYDSSPIYGYRPLANREYNRFLGAKIAFNNLGLRADADWQPDNTHKVLFLGDSITYGGSRIANHQLFSHVAGQLLGEEFQTGNGGVNGWGVENIHGLIVETEFLPAKTYVTTLIEEDFYRGLTRLKGMIFFNKSPGFALNELWHFFITKQLDSRYLRWQEFAEPQHEAYVVQKAVRRLKEMDLFLKERGYNHLILISPLKDQVFGNSGKDPLVARTLGQMQVPHAYLLGELRKESLSGTAPGKIFYDTAHLTAHGHALWGEIIAGKLQKLLGTPQTSHRITNED